MQSFFETAISEGRMRPVPTESLSLTWLGALRNRAFFTHMMPSLHLDGDDVSYVQELTEVLWRGLCPDKES
jgi:hypothetical protein